MSRRKIRTPGVYHDKNGTYYLKYKNKTYRRFKTVEEAEIKKAQLMLNPESVNDATLEIIVSDYLDFEINRYKNEEISYGTYDKQESVLRLYILTQLKGVKLKDIDAALLRKFRDDLSTKDLSSVHKNYTLSVLKSVFRHAQKYHDLKEDFSIYLENFPKTQKEKNKNKERFQNIWNQKEFELFLDNIEELDYKLIFILMFSHGMRVGEVLALLWSKINFDDKSIIVDGSITKKTQNKGVERVSTKTTSSERIIYVGDETIKLFETLYEDVKTIYKFNNGRYVFGFNQPYTLRQIKRRREKAIKEAGLSNATNHDLRHMFVTNSWSSAPITALSRYIGHKNVSVTLERYSHLSQEDNEKMNKYIDKSI